MDTHHRGQAGHPGSTDTRMHQGVDFIPLDPLKPFPRSTSDHSTTTLTLRVPRSCPIDILDRLLCVRGPTLGSENAITLSGVYTPPPSSTTGLVAPSRCRVGRSLRGFRSSLVLWGSTWSCSTRLHISHRRIETLSGRIMWGYGSCSHPIWSSLVFQTFALCGFLSRLAQVHTFLPSLPRITILPDNWTGPAHLLERVCLRRS